MTDISTHMRNTAAMLATAATLLTGCQRKTEAVAPANDTNLAQRALPAAPLLSPDREITKLLSDPALPGDVRSALMNPRVHAILQSLWESGKTDNPVSYLRNAYPSTEGVQTVVVLQHLLNIELPRTLQQGAEHRQALLKHADTQSSPFREDTLGTVRWINRFLDTPATPLALDGDFGPRCHKRRAIITQIANLTSQFPHIKEDSGSNDTAIGPRTLRLLTEGRPEFRPYFEADFAVIALSHNEAVNSSPRR